MKLNKLIALGLVGATASAFAADWWTLEDGVLTLNNDNADLTASTNDYSAVIGKDVTKIVKTGPGAVRLSGTNPDFAGEIEVQQGLLMGWVREGYTVDKVNYKTADNYGAPSKVTVANGATFEMLATPIVNVAYTGSRFANTQFYVEGDGVGGRGALYRYGSLQSGERSYATVKHVTLNGPTTFGVGMRWGFNGTCSLNQNGHTLTLKKFGTNAIFNFSREGQLTISNPGDVILDGASLCNEGTYPPAAAAGQTLTDSTLVITNGADCWLLPKDKTTIGSFALTYQVLSYGGTLSGPNANTAAYDYMATVSGDVTLTNGTTTLRAYSQTGAARLALTGRVNGPGTLATYQNANNTGDANKLTSMTLLGGGAGAENAFNKLNLQGGSLALTGGAAYAITNGGSVAGYSRSDKFLARLVVTNATLVMPTAVEQPYTSGWASRYNLTVGEDSSKFGVVELGRDAVVTNDMAFGRTAKGAGALYLHDNAQLYWHGGGGSNPFLGSGGYGFMGLRDNATIGNLGYFNIGSNSGRSFVIQRGGTYLNTLCNLPGHKCTIHGTAFKIGRNDGEAHYYQCGGTQRSAGNVCFTWDYATAVKNSRGSFTVDGSADSEVNDVCFCITLAGTSRFLNYKATDLGTFGHVNVNGGTLKVNRVYKTSQGGGNMADGTAANWNNTKNVCPNSWAFVNFNGGTLKVKGAGDFFSQSGTADNARLPTRVTVYENGATIDTDVASTWRLPLEKPYGLGVRSVTLTSDILSDKTYLGPGWIKFAGDGSNTTALVDFDETVRESKGVIVTSAGFAYTAKPTVTVEKSNCAGQFWTIPAENVEMVDFDAADSAVGGLTKKGSGTLTLAGANTYGGATRVEAGTLAFTHANGYPGGDLVFSGKTLAADAPKATVQNLAFRAGAGIRIVDAEALDAKTYGKRRAIVEVASALSSLPSVTFVSTNGATLATGGNWNGWNLRLAADGKSIGLAAERGLVLIVK